MRNWIKQERNQMAAAVWAFGVFYLYKSVGRPNGLFELPHTAVGTWQLFTMVVAGPVGWGLTKRARWAKWTVFSTIVVLGLLQLPAVIASPTLFSILASTGIIFGLFQLARWDIARDTQFNEDFHERLSAFLEERRPRPLAASSVTLEFNQYPSISCQSLAAAVAKAFGRECKISESTDNIDLGVEVAMTEHTTAVVGGFQSDTIGHWIVGARPVSLDVSCVVLSGEEPAPTRHSVLTVSTPHQFDHEAKNLNGYDWTIPLAAVLWTPNTVCATVGVGDSEVRFTSSNDLQNWRKMTIPL